MKLQFKHQQFQVDATNAVSNIFIGQPNSTPNQFIRDLGTSKEDSQLSLTPEDNFGYKNAPIALNEFQILQNLNQVQSENNINPISTELATLTSQSAQENVKNSRAAFTIEMETGTGKTYTYIKTIHDLHQKYNWTKFIIVVPSIAIREGVLKTFQITEDHFKSIYGQSCSYFVYDSSNLSNLDSFASSPGIQVMIINTHAFNSTGKDNRRIYMELDSFRSRRPIDVIAAVNPILIIDEPQSVLGDSKKKNKTYQNIGVFNPLFYLTYSATHRDFFNPIYKLDAVDAYHQQLVKKIQVKGITVNTSNSNGYLYLQRINTYTNKSPSATVLFEFATKTQSGISKKTKTFSHGDNLYEHSNHLAAYEDRYIISNIDAKEGIVEFTNGLTLQEGEVVGQHSQDEIRRIQIRETIQSHLEKETLLFEKGIKTLSLFFIDEVAKYRTYQESEGINGQYAQFFEEEYKQAVKNHIQELEQQLIPPLNYIQYLKQNLETPQNVHNGYFAQDKKGNFQDSSETAKPKDHDIAAYDLIMKNKERLLSLQEPTRFIFSHSALREGWDNPNVFQICTLRESKAEIKKRQEIGRGLRLCVNQAGERMDQEYCGQNAVHDINVLTVIANESYDQFAKDLQDELAEIMKRRPQQIIPELFFNKSYRINDQIHKITEEEAQDIVSALRYENQIDKVTKKASKNFVESTTSEQEALLSHILTKINPELAEHALTTIHNLIQSTYLQPDLIQNERRSYAPQRQIKHFHSPEFSNLWNKINQKTIYTLQNFPEAEFIDNTLERLHRNLTSVVQLQVEVATGSLRGTTSTLAFSKESTKSDYLADTLHQAPIDLIKEIAEGASLTRNITAQILTRLQPSTFSLYKQNPQDFIRQAVALINSTKSQYISKSITYQKIDQFFDKDKIFKEYLPTGNYASNLIDTTEKHLYDKLRYDSQIEKELAQAFEKDGNIQFYIKLPSDYTIETPIGTYNPDWAIVLTPPSHSAPTPVYIVAESKGSTNEDSLRMTENVKIDCARKHFTAISDDQNLYHVISSIDDLKQKAALR